MRGCLGAYDNKEDKGDCQPAQGKIWMTLGNPVSLLFIVKEP